MEYLAVVEQFLVEDDDRGVDYSVEVQVDDAVVRVKATNDEDIVAVVYPMADATHKPEDYRNLAYEVATSLLSENTNNDGCDVWVRERSAHLSSHEDLSWLNLPDDFTRVVVTAWVEDWMT